MKLIVFARRHLEPRITNKECGRRGTGVGDRMGNKGGVVATMRLYVFVCAVFLLCFTTAFVTRTNVCVSS